MTEAREAILGRVRRALHGLPPAPAAPGPSPGCPQGAGRQRFAERLTAASASLAALARRDALPTAVGDYLAAHGLAPRLVAAPHPLLRELSWPAPLAIDWRAARPDDAVALSVAFAGIAESGSLVLRSGPATPTTLNFLPDICLCLLPAARILPCLEDLWPRLRAEGPLPRAINLITGPSRTADVEQTIALGAHGPRRLHVLLLDDGG